jgi:hypothetical protein
VSDMITLRPFEQDRFNRLVELARNRFDAALTSPRLTFSCIRRQHMPSLNHRRRNPALLSGPSSSAGS